MEEILASIRRIIADDDDSKSAPRSPEPAKARAPTSIASRLMSPVSQVNAGRSETAPAINGAGMGEQSSDILDLTESVAASTPRESAPAPAAAPTPAAPPQFRRVDGHSDVSCRAADKSLKPIDASRAHIDGESGLRRDGERAQLLSRETSAAVDSAFNTLAQTFLVQNARTLEDLVREMLRPMLKTWLDDNLPGMVERLVRAEIERVSRGRAT